MKKNIWVVECSCYTKNEGSFGIFEKISFKSKEGYFQFLSFLLCEISRNFHYFMNSSVTYLKFHVIRKRKRRLKNPSLALLEML